MELLESARAPDLLACRAMKKWPQDVHKVEVDGVARALGVHRQLKNVLDRREDRLDEDQRDVRRRVARAPSSVLLAENALDLRTLIRVSLIEDGYDVNEAADGSQVLDMLRTALSFPLRMPDVIVMGVAMPRYSGLSILSAIRSADWVTPVIMMSTVDDETMISKARSLGAAAFFKQPFDIDDLRAAVITAASTLDAASVRKLHLPTPP